MGVPRVDHMLMILGISLMMNEQEREVVTREMMRGFNDCATEADTKVTGGQSIMNPWPIIGGVANVVVLKDEYVRPNFGKDGDVIVLTKPLGTQPAVNMFQKKQKDSSWSPAEVTHQQIDLAYHLAVESMATLNKNTSVLLHKYHSHGATDITGFGILGHAKNLAAAQFDDVDIVIDTLPIITGCGIPVTGMHDFKVTEGYSAETSGGILTLMEPQDADLFRDELLKEYGQRSWIVGKVIKG